jgi:hypothetical protein
MHSAKLVKTTRFGQRLGGHTTRKRSASDVKFDDPAARWWQAFLD